MAVESILRDQSGQSVIEFLLMFPVLLGLFSLTLRVNTAIQMAIVNQQYSRQQALILAGNSNIYPLLRIRERELTGHAYNQMLMGVSENNPDSGGGDDAGDSGGLVDASTYRISMSKRPGLQGSDDAQSEPDKRTKVRIRNTVTLCTQTENLGKTERDAILPLKKAKVGGEDSAVASGRYNLRETPGNVLKFPFCLAADAARYDSR